MKGELLRAIPAGTSIAQARAVMERNAFTCVEYRDAPFGGEDHMDYVWCDHQAQEGLVRRRWQVALVRSGDELKGVRVAISLTGP